MEVTILIEDKVKKSKVKDIMGDKVFCFTF